MGPAAVVPAPAGDLATPILLGEDEVLALPDVDLVPATLETGAGADDGLGHAVDHVQLEAQVVPGRVRVPAVLDPALSTVGRLDRDTSGLLLLTDDGQLLHKIISPKARVPKAYDAHLAQDLRGDEAALFAAGTLMLDGETTPLAPAQLETLAPRHARLTVTEGRYHQVRRMFAATGNAVTALERIAVGGLRLDALELDAGQWRALDADEIARVFGAGR